MEAAERQDDSASGSDSDATRILDSDSDTAYDSQDDALSVASASTADGAVEPPQDAVVDLADDDEETEFVILPAAPAAQPDTASDSDDALPIGLVAADADVSDDAPPASSSVSKKRKRLRQSVEPPAKKPAKTEKPTIVYKPQPTECTVCYDPCTNSGRHRLVSLKCGHVFGKKCIDRWVLERRTCPNCSVTVRKADIRPLFTDHVAIVDNTGVEDMAQKFEAEKGRRIQIETELSRTKLQLQLLQNEAKRHQDEAAQWRKQVADMQCRLASERFTATPVPAAPMASQAAPSSQFSQLAWTPSQPAITPTKPSFGQLSQPSSAMFSPPYASMVSSQLATPSSQVPTDNGSNYRVLFRYQLHNSRVCAISPSCSLLCVGEAFSSTSFGIVKLSTADTRHAVRIAAHQSAVRDLAMSVRDDFVMSVAFDGKLAVSSFRSDSIVMQYMLPPNKRNAWSCSFSQVDPFALFCGFHDGTIAKYDMRRPSMGAAPVALFELPVRQPVHSIQLCPTMGGQQELLVAGTFAGFGVWSSEKLLHPQAGGAPTPTTSFDAVAGCSSVASAQTGRSRLLVTTRTQPQAASATHAVYDLPAMMTGASALAKRSTLTGFRTPQVISRSAIWETRDGDTNVASWDEEQKVVNVWDEGSAQVKTRLSPFGTFASTAPVVDVQHSVASADWRRSRALLAVLSPQELILYGSNS